MARQLPRLTTAERKSVRRGCLERGAGAAAAAAGPRAASGFAGASAAAGAGAGASASNEDSTWGVAPVALRRIPAGPLLAALLAAATLAAALAALAASVCCCCCCIAAAAAAAWKRSSSFEARTSSTQAAAGSPRASSGRDRILWSAVRTLWLSAPAMDGRLAWAAPAADAEDRSCCGRTGGCGTARSIAGPALHPGATAAARPPPPPPLPSRESARSAAADAGSTRCIGCGWGRGRRADLGTCDASRLASDPPELGLAPSAGVAASAETWNDDPLLAPLARPGAARDPHTETRGDSCEGWVGWWWCGNRRAPNTTGSLTPTPSSVACWTAAPSRANRGGALSATCVEKTTAVAPPPWPAAQKSHGGSGAGPPPPPLPDCACAPAGMQSTAVARQSGSEAPGSGTSDSPSARSSATASKGLATRAAPTGQISTRQGPPWGACAIRRVVAAPPPPPPP